MSEMPSSLFLRHTATTCGTKSRALHSSPSPKITATICFISGAISPPPTVQEQCLIHESNSIIFNKTSDKNAQKSALGATSWKRGRISAFRAYETLQLGAAGHGVLHFAAVGPGSHGPTGRRCPVRRVGVAAEVATRRSRPVAARRAGPGAGTARPRCAVEHQACTADADRGEEGRTGRRAEL